jgi:hypothetical protein
VTRTAVFVGPSLDSESVRRELPDALVEPPAARGDIARLRAEGVSTFLLIDGVFAHRLAVSPREIVDALAAGCRVLGAASLGAIRAAECRPAGMEGVGAVQLLYRWRVLTGDDEVAVATEPDRDYRASSVALVSVRFAVLAALRARLVDRDCARDIVGAAKRLYFSQRQWPAILAAAGVRAAPALIQVCEQTDVKRRDAELAVARLGGFAPVAPRTVPSFEPARRYRGHDPMFGFGREELEPMLWRWLRDSGRRAHLRSTPSATWDVLAQERELEPELMRWYAHQRATT